MKKTSAIILCILMTNGFEVQAPGHEVANNKLNHTETISSSAFDNANGKLPVPVKATQATTNSTPGHEQISPTSSHEKTNNGSKLDLDFSQPDAGKGEKFASTSSSAPVKPTKSIGITSEETTIKNSSDMKIDTKKTIAADGKSYKITDSNGKLYSELTPDGRTIDYEYNNQGIPTKTIESIPNKLNFIKPSTKTTIYNVDTKNPTEITITDSSGKIMSTQKFEYDFTVKYEENKPTATTTGILKKITTTDSRGNPIKTQTFDADGKAYTITDAKGKVIESKIVNSSDDTYTVKNAKGKTIEESKFDKATGKRETIKYNKSKESAIDKSSTKTIIDSAHPDETIIEIRNKDDKLIERTTTGADGIPHTAKITDIKTTRDLSEEEFDLFSQAIAKMSSAVTRNNTMGKSMDITHPAVRIINARIRNLPETTRQLRQKTLARMQSEKTSIKAINKMTDPTIDPATGKYRRNEDGTPMTKEEIVKFNSHADGRPMTQTELYQRNTAEKLLQDQLNNIFGKDTTSEENISSWKSDFPVSKAEIIANLQKKLFTEETTEQSLADAQDLIMNTLSCYDVKNPAGNPPPFRTKININQDGTTTSSTIITNESGISSNITTDNSTGKITMRQLTVINPDGLNDKQAAVFITTFDATGNPTTKINSATIDGSKEPKNAILTDSEQDLITAAHDALTTKQIAIATIKASLWTVKQVAPNFIKISLPVQGAIIASAIPVLILVKVGSMLPRYDVTTGQWGKGNNYEDPVLRSFINHSIEMTVGNRRGFSAADPNRVFTKGTAPSKAIQALKGHSNIAEAHVGSAIYEAISTFSFEPIAQSYSIAFPEQRDPTAEYYRSLDDIIIENSVDFLKKAFTSKDSGGPSSANFNTTGQLALSSAFNSLI